MECLKSAGKLFPWKQLSLVNDEEVISLSHAKVYVFSDSVLCLGKVNQNPASKTVWEEQLVVFALKTEVFAFASRSKAKAKPRRHSTTCSSPRTVPVLERTWFDIEPGAQFDQAYPVAKRLNTLLRHGELPRDEDGAIEFWRLTDDLRNKFEYSQSWSDDVWKSKMAGGGGNKKRFQYCTDPSGQEILYLRALQGHSGRDPIDPAQHDNVLIPNNFFEYIYHIGCAVNLHSITNSGLIAGGKILAGTYRRCSLQPRIP